MAPVSQLAEFASSPTESSTGACAPCKLSGGAGSIVVATCVASGAPSCNAMQRGASRRQRGQVLAGIRQLGVETQGPRSRLHDRCGQHGRRQRQPRDGEEQGIVHRTRPAEELSGRASLAHGVGRFSKPSLADWKSVLRFAHLVAGRGRGSTDAGSNFARSGVAVRTPSAGTSNLADQTMPLRISIRRLSSRQLR